MNSFNNNDLVERNGVIILQETVALDKIIAPDDFLEYDFDESPYLSMIDNFVEGRSIARDLKVILNQEPKYSFKKDYKERDDFSYVYSTLERSVIGPFTAGLVNPGASAIRACVANGIIDMRVYCTNVTTMSDNDYDEYTDYLEKAAFKEGFGKGPRIVTLHHKRMSMDDLPKHEKLFFCANGSALNGFEKTKWYGLEYNPYAASVHSACIQQVEKREAYYHITYRKKGLIMKTRYYDDPTYFRVHGHDVMRMLTGKPRPEHNLFNYVSSRPFICDHKMRISKELSSISGPGRSISCGIVSQKTIKKTINDVIVNCDIGFCRHDCPVELISPVYEISTRNRILKHFGVQCTKANESDYNVRSGHSSTYVAFSSKGDFIRSTYRREVMNIPGKWVSYNGEWRVKVYPGAEKRARPAKKGKKKKNSKKVYDYYFEGRKVSCSEADINMLLPVGKFYEIVGDKLYEYKPDNDGDEYYHAKSEIPPLHEFRAMFPITTLTDGRIVTVENGIKVVEFSSVIAKNQAIKLNGGRPGDLITYYMLSGAISGRTVLSKKGFSAGALFTTSFPLEKQSFDNTFDRMMGNVYGGSFATEYLEEQDVEDNYFAHMLG